MFQSAHHLRCFVLSCLWGCLLTSLAIGQDRTENKRRDATQQRNALGTNDRSVPRLAGDSGRPSDGKADDRVAITASIPAVVSALAPNSMRQATLFGGGLGKITSARVTHRGQVVPGVQVELGPVAPAGRPTGNATSPSEYRPLRIRAQSGPALRGELALEVEVDGTWRATPLKLIAAPSPATSPAVGRNSNAPRAPSTRQPAPPAAAAPSAARRAVPASQFDALRREIVNRSKYVPTTGGSSWLSPVELTFDGLAGSVRTLPTATVDSFRPAGTKAAFGSLLQLNGANLGDQSVQVRFGNQVLTVIQRSDNQLTVALPDGGPAAITDKLEISSANLAKGWKTIHAQYQLMPESQLQPRLVVDAFDGAPLSADGLPYDRTAYRVVLTFHEVPGDYLESFDIDFPFIDTATITSTTNFSFNSFSVVVDGVEMPATGPIRSWFTTRRQGDAQSKKSFTGVEVTVAKKIRPVHVVTETSGLKDVLKFELTDGWGLIQGETIGIHGTVTVGQLEIGNDLAFRITSGPTGASATWVSSMIQLNNGWSLVEMEWDEVAVFPDGASPAARVVRQGGTFDRGQLYVGWQTIPTLGPAAGGDDDSPMVRFFSSQTDNQGNVWHNPAPYNQPRHRFARPLRVELKAAVLPDNNNHVTARLKSIKLRGPEGANWQQAFGNSTAYANGQWLVDTMNPIELKSGVGGPNH